MSRKLTTRTTWKRLPGGVQVRGRQFSAAELVFIRNTIRRHPTWGRTKLSQKLCVELKWYQADGRVKERACRVALLKLESLKLLKLPMRLVHTGGKAPRIEKLDNLVTDMARLETMPEDIEIRHVSNHAERRIWNAAISQHHYLGLRTSVGRILRYLYFTEGKLLGACSFTECAWSIAARAKILPQLGLDTKDFRNLIVNNNRFLILPGAHVKNLASRMLSSTLRVMASDWERLYGTVPRLAETFVDPSRFAGTCYRAANWLVAGQSKGFAKSGSQHVDGGAEKVYLLRGVDSSTHRDLARVIEMGKIWEPKDRFSIKSTPPTCRVAA